MIDETLRQRLLTLAAHDRATRERLVHEGGLFVGYAAEMERVHVENAAELSRIFDAHGWPGRSLVADDGCAAAWTIAMHAISVPALQRRALALVERAAAGGGAPRDFPARLVDRIRFNERKPQVFGTIFDWEPDGRLGPGPIEDSANVDERRAAVGLPPLAAEAERMRTGPREKGDGPPLNYAARQREVAAWARKVGWIE